jgi:hypothetical protein
MTDYRLTPGTGRIEIRGGRARVTWTYLRRNWVCLVPAFLITFATPPFNCLLTGWRGVLLNLVLAGSSWALGFRAQEKITASRTR